MSRSRGINAGPGQYGEGIARTLPESRFTPGGIFQSDRSGGTRRTFLVRRARSIAFLAGDRRFFAMRLTGLNGAADQSRPPPHVPTGAFDDRVLGSSIFHVGHAENCQTSRICFGSPRPDGRQNVPIRQIFPKEEQTAAAGIASRVRTLNRRTPRGLASRPSQSSAGSRFFNASIWPK